MGGWGLRTRIFPWGCGLRTRIFPWGWGLGTRVFPWVIYILMSGWQLHSQSHYVRESLCVTEETGLL